MKHDNFINIENAPDTTPLNITKACNHLVFNEQGLTPVTIQNINTKEVLMFAWINRQALGHTINTKRVTY